MLRGGKPQRGVAKSYTTSNDTFCVLNWLNLASRRKMHKCILVFKCLNNLAPKYFTQYFTRNADLHDHATKRSNDLHPPKPKRNMGKRTFKYMQMLFISILHPIMLKVPRLWIVFKRCWPSILPHNFNLLSLSTHF